MVYEKIIKLLGQSAKFLAVSVLDVGRTHRELKELSLKDKMVAGIDIIWLNTEALVLLLETFF